VGGAQFFASNLAPLGRRNVFFQDNLWGDFLNAPKKWNTTEREKDFLKYLGQFYSFTLITTFSSPLLQQTDCEMHPSFI